LIDTIQMATFATMNTKASIFNQGYLPKAIPQSYLPRIPLALLQETLEFVYPKKDEQVRFPPIFRSQSSLNHFQQGIQTSKAFYNGFATVMAQSQILTPNYFTPSFQAHQKSFAFQTSRILNGNVVNVPRRTVQNAQNMESGNCEGASLFRYKTQDNQSTFVRRKRIVQPIISSASEDTHCLLNEKLHPLSNSEIETQTETDSHYDEVVEASPKSILKKNSQSRYSFDESLASTTTSFSLDSRKESLSSLSPKKVKRVSFATQCD
jgi:hypothetical protein